MKPYLDTYFKMIPFAEKLAKEYGAEHDALLITEAHNFNGVQWGKDKRYLRNNFGTDIQADTKDKINCRL